MPNNINNATRKALRGNLFIFSLILLPCMEAVVVFFFVFVVFI